MTQTKILLGRSFQIAKRGLIPLLAVVAVFLSSCGYTTGPMLRRDIRSVSVETFDNVTWRRGLEVDLTRQLTRELRSRTALQLKSSGEADSTLRGSIIGYHEAPVTETEDDEIILRRITVKVQFRWVDNVTGRNLVEPGEFSERNTFAIARGEPLAERIFGEVAETIVEKMERDW